jgi:hypothetical protein
MAKANSVPSTTVPSVTGLDKEAVRLHKQAFKSKATGQEATDFMSVDVVQFLALGLIAFDEVQASANARMLETKDFAIGKVFDLFTAARPDHLDYVEHVIAVAEEIQPRDVITQNDIFFGSYYKVRQQLKIVSGLETEVDEDGTVLGRFFRIERRNVLASGKAYPFVGSKLLGAGIHEDFKLYAKLDELNQPTGEFYMLDRNDDEVYVQIGDVSVWSDTIQNLIDYNIVKRYNTLLASVDRDVKVGWYKQGYAMGGADTAQQYVFLNILKMFKAEADYQVVSPTTADAVVTEPANA